MGAPDRSVWDWSLGFAVLKDSFLAHGRKPVGILTSWFPLAACRRPGEQITVCNGRVRAKRIRGISVSHQSPTVIGGVKGGGAPHEGEKTKIRKADADKTDNQYVQGVQGRFYLSSHF